MSSRLDPYMKLLQCFGQKEITAVEFEEYLKLYKNDSTDWTEVEFEILDELFGEVDAFCSNPNLREEGDLDEVQLREACKKAWMNLRDLASNRYSVPMQVQSAS